MKLLISVDIEGVAGFSHPQDGMPGGPFYGEARGWMTGEALAACEAAKAAGASDILLSDGHGLGRNLILDKLPDYVQAITSWPRPLLIASGCEEEGVAGAAFIGHHCGSQDEKGMMSHSIHGAHFFHITIDGQPLSETLLHAAVMGEHGVPVIMVSGDQAYCDHAQSILGDIEAVPVKWGYGNQSARSLSPARSREVIAEGITRAITKLDQAKLFTLPMPAEIEVTMLRGVMAELYDYLPFAKRTQGNKVVFTVNSASEAARILMFMAIMQPIA